MLRNLISKTNVLFISLGMLGLITVYVVLISRVARADEQTTFKGNFIVQAELLTTLANCAPGDTSCSTCLNNSGIYVEAQGLGRTSFGPMFFEVLKCFNPAGGSFGTYAGTFKMTDPRGKDSVTGTYAGQNDNAGNAYGFGPFSGKLTLTGGTGKFESARGDASFTAVGGPFTPGPNPSTFALMAFYSLN